MGTAPRHDFGVVVPVRAFRLGNRRLATGLDDEARATLARRLATRVVAAAGDAPVVVVTGAAEVSRWAATVGAAVVDDPGSLDAAARRGVEVLGRAGCRRAVVAHADLPFATTFAPVARDSATGVAALVPCHHDDGTPVLSIPTDAATAFGFAYGPGSFRRHVAAAHAIGLGVRVVRDPTLAFDVDTLDDLAELARRDPSLVDGCRTAEATP